MKIEHLHNLFLQSKGITTDTRNIKRGQLFFALKGDNFNGNRFAHQAVSKSGFYAVIDEKEYAVDENYILVEDVLESLQELARFHRKYLKIPILAITGSNGKTTSKELINGVLRRKFETVATSGNLNNHIGVPLTLLSMKRTTELGIVEMGANHPGEIKALCEIALPDYGYITNFGKAHLEGFGSVEGVIKAKSELYDHLKENGKLLILNVDDPVQARQSSYTNVFSFGTTPGAHLCVEYPQNNITAEVTSNSIHYKSSLTGNYNAVNIAAAVCIGNYFKVPEEAILRAIAAYSPTNNRSQIIKIGKLSLLMDAYNANPTSMNAALDSFNNFPARTKMVILGDMFELGLTSGEEHNEIVRKLEKLNLEKAYLIGEHFYNTNESGTNIEKFKTFQDFEHTITENNPGECHILVKGSRGMALERVIDIFKNSCLD